MKVPYLFLQYENKELIDELTNAARECFKESKFILGPNVGKFEKNLSEYIGVNFAIGVNSGTDAILLSLMANNVGNGDEVITVANSFIATSNVIKLLHAEPVFVDIKDNLLIDENLFEEKISEKTKAIIPVHLTGKPANMTKITKIADEYNIPVIEDCAQAIGAKWDEKKVGSFGIGCFSLHPLKNLSACGDGGIITTNDKEFYEKISKLRNHGLKDRNTIIMPGLNSRLDELQAAVLNVKRKYLDRTIKKRRELANKYKELFKEKSMIDLLYFPYDTKNEFSVYHTYVVRVNKRDKLMKHLSEKGIETKIHYPKSIHRQKPYENNRYSLPKTELFEKQILSLPIHQYLNFEQIEYVVNSMREFYGK